MQATDPEANETAAPDHAPDHATEGAAAPEPASVAPEDAPSQLADTPAAQEAFAPPDMKDAPVEPSVPEPPNEANPPQAPKGIADLSPAQCAAKLAELFPAIFAPAGPAAPGVAMEAPKPLKLRIQADIQQRAPGIFSKRSLSIFLSRYTTSNAYIRALLAAPHRFDLDGQAAGDISEEHLAAAKEEMARRRAIHEERRAAEREAHRQARIAAHHQAQGDGLPRPPREPRAARNDDPRNEAANAGAKAPHAARGPRPARPPRSSHASERPRAPQGAHGAVTPQTNAAHGQPSNSEARARPAFPEDPARRERAMLLRLFEASPLTKANFCVLKRISEVDLDAQLELARQERGPAPRR